MDRRTTPEERGLGVYTSPDRKLDEYEVSEGRSFPPVVKDGGERVGTPRSLVTGGQRGKYESGTEVGRDWLPLQGQW